MNENNKCFFVFLCKYKWSQIDRVYFCSSTKTHIHLKEPQLNSTKRFVMFKVKSLGSLTLLLKCHIKIGFIWQNHVSTCSICFTSVFLHQLNTNNLYLNNNINVFNKLLNLWILLKINLLIRHCKKMHNKLLNHFYY